MTELEKVGLNGFYVGSNPTSAKQGLEILGLIYYSPLIAINR